MNWVETVIVEVGKLLRYALRTTATTARLCVVLGTVTACIVVLAWKQVF